MYCNIYLSVQSFYTPPGLFVNIVIQQSHPGRKRWKTGEPVSLEILYILIYCNYFNSSNISDVSSWT